jgi:hypothetical protein
LTSSVQHLGITMSVKREAAFHEAGHAVVAYRSRFHNIVGPINLAAYGSGEIFVSLSRTKLQTQGKTPTAAAARDKEVAVDLAVVLCAGLAAERLAECREPGIVASPECAVPDHELLRQQLAGAGLSQKFDRHEQAARQQLEAEWPLVLALANHLLEKTYVGAADVTAFIEEFQK